MPGHSSAAGAVPLVPALSRSSAGASSTELSLSGRARLRPGSLRAGREVQKKSPPLMIKEGGGGGGTGYSKNTETHAAFTDRSASLPYYAAFRGSLSVTYGNQNV